MTREEIERLEGRELDAAVAEHVMGWLGPVLWVEDDDGCDPYMFAPTPECRAAAERNDRAYDHIVDWYSSDIQSAWSVVEKMRQQGWRLDLGEHEDEWEAVFYTPDQRAEGYGATAPEAIARAALLAVCWEAGEDDAG